MGRRFATAAGSDRYERLAAGFDGRTRPRARMASPVVLDLLDERVRDVVDVGVGTGLIWSVIGRQTVDPLRVVGLDASMAMLRFAAAARPWLRLVGGSVDALPFGPATFDVALMAFSARECGHPVTAASSVRSTLRDHGRLLVLDYSDRCVVQLADAAVQFYAVLDLLQGPRADTPPYSYLSFELLVDEATHGGFTAGRVHSARVTEALGPEAIVDYLVQMPPMDLDFHGLPTGLRAECRRLFAGRLRSSGLDRRLMTEINWAVLRAD